jgi:hypothetical protein
MAQQSYYGEFDPERYQDFPVPEGGLQDVQQPGAFDLNAFYQQTLGRAPDANELATDSANIAKYGADAFSSDFLSKRPNNQPGSGSYAPQTATAQYSGGGSTAAGSGDAALSQFMQMLQSQQSQQQQQQASLREILMGQLNQASQPVSADAPGIREVLAGQRIGLQRGAERQRGDAAEMRAYDGSGGLGGKAFSGDVARINQQQGEQEAQMAGGVLHDELNAKRDQLTKLLSMAMALGDSESARNIQAQLSGIQTQLQQSNVYDQQAFNYASLNQQGNLQALMALLGAV